MLGQWSRRNDEALHDPAPTGIEIAGKPEHFLLQNGNAYYLFVNDLNIGGFEHVATNTAQYTPDNIFTLDKRIKAACWLDSGEPLDFTQEGSQVNIQAKQYKYGEDHVVRIAKIEV